MKEDKPLVSTKTSEQEVSASLSANLYQLWVLLCAGRSVQIIILILLMMLAAVLEMATLAAAIPLIGSLIDAQSGNNTVVVGSAVLPEFITQSENPHNLVLGAIVVIVCISAFVRILVIRLTADFSATVGVELQTLYFRELLYRDYETAINQSSSKDISLITNKIQIVISNYILGILTTLTSMVSAAGVLIMLIWLSTPVVFLALGMLLVAYLVIAWLSRTKLKSYGRDLQVYIPQKVRCVQEGLGGFRDVAMAGTQDIFVRRLAYVAKKVEIAVARLVFYNSFPRPLLEAAGICSIATIAWLAHRGTYTNEQLLPTLGVFALGMLRLLPYVQQVFGQWTRMFNGQLILAELLNTIGKSSETHEQHQSINSEELIYQHSIELADVEFSYQGSNSEVFRGLDLKIAKGEYIGIVGPTGSGKSTFVDLLMGLIPPTKGELLIDGMPLDTIRREQWRRKVAHVPQKIYLTEGSVESNIAFAVNEEQVDNQRVRRCARAACADEFIRQLPRGYDTVVGEDGIRLSGGQKQRIGIARALYGSCSVLVFDEETNALDQLTEKAVIEGLLQMDRNYTLISITHNIESAKHCKRILKIDNGSAYWLS